MWSLIFDLKDEGTLSIPPYIHSQDSPYPRNGTLPDARATSTRSLPLSQMFSVICHVLWNSVRQLVVCKCMRLYIYDFTHPQSPLESQLRSPIRTLDFFCSHLLNLLSLWTMSVINHPPWKWTWRQTAIVSYGTQELFRGPSSQPNLCWTLSNSTF